MDVDRFVEDVQAGRLARRVQQDAASGDASGAHGTPTFFVSRVRHVGAYDAVSLAAELPRRRTRSGRGLKLRQPGDHQVAVGVVHHAVLLDDLDRDLIPASSCWKVVGDACAVWRGNVQARIRLMSTLNRGTPDVHVDVVHVGGNQGWLAAAGNHLGRRSGRDVRFDQVRSRSSGGKHPVTGLKEFVES